MLFTITIFSVMWLESGQVESSGICSKEVKLQAGYGILTKINPHTYVYCLVWILPCLTMKKTLKKKVSCISAFPKSRQWSEMSSELHEDPTYPLAALGIMDVPSYSDTPVATLSSKLVLLTSWLVFAGFGFWTVKNEFLKTMFSLYCRGNAELI